MGAVRVRARARPSAGCARCGILGGHPVRRAGCPRRARWHLSRKGTKAGRKKGRRRAREGLGRAIIAPRGQKWLVGRFFGSGGHLGVLLAAWGRGVCGAWRVFYALIDIYINIIYACVRALVACVCVRVCALACGRAGAPAPMRARARRRRCYSPLPVLKNFLKN